MERSVEKLHNPVIYIMDGSIDITGAFICARNEAKILRNEVDVVMVLPETTKISDEHLVDFKKVVRLPIVNIRKSLLSLITYFPALVIASWRLKKMMKYDGCDNLQINDFYLMHGVVVCMFGFKGRLVTWVRIDPRRFGSLFSRLWLGLGYRYSNHVVAVSRFIQELLPQSPKTRLVYDPVYIRGTDETAYSERARHSVRRLVYIGNYIEGKGQQYAIAAFLQVAMKYSDVQLHFYGGDMGLEKNLAFRKRLEMQAASSPYCDRILFHDYVNDIESVLGGAFAALNFSESESFSLSCLEASHHGLPVIATRSGGPQEIVEDQRTGLLVNTGDVGAMRDAIEVLLKDKEIAKEMGRNGARHVARKFSEDAFRKNIHSIFGWGNFS